MYKHKITYVNTVMNLWVNISYMVAGSGSNVNVNK